MMLLAMMYRLQNAPMMGIQNLASKNDGFNDVKNDGFDDVVSNAENIDDYFNTQDVDNNDKAVANKIDNVNVFIAVVEDCDSHDDPSQDEGASFDVTKVSDLVDNVNTIDVFSNVFSPVDDGCEEDVYNTDFIGNQVVEYRRLSSIQYEVVITNHDKEVEVSYLDNGNHIYSIFSCKRYKEENPCYVDSYREITEVECAKPLIFSRHCGLTRQDSHVSYKTNKTDEGVYVCSSQMEFMNWAFGREDPITISLCCKSDVSDVYGEDVNVIYHTDFFSPMGALLTMVDFCVENIIMVRLLTHEINDVSSAVTNAMSFLLNVYGAIITATFERRGIFLLLFDVRHEPESGQSNVFDTKRCHDLVQETSSSINHQCQEEMEWCSQVAALIASLRSRMSQYWWDSSSQEDLLILSRQRPLGDLSIPEYIYMCRERELQDQIQSHRWKDSLLYCGNNNSGELFEEHTDGEKYHLLVVVGSFGGVVMIGGLSKVHILHHHQVLVNMESSMVHVIFVLLHHVFPMVLVFPTTSISRESRASFICWSEVACESRKLLTCGKLSFVVACFSTNVRFLALSWSKLTCKYLQNQISTSTTIQSIENPRSTNFVSPSSYNRRSLHSKLVVFRFNFPNENLRFGEMALSAA
ncbi:unnamed protein product [Arabidopsis thaliana]|uniref:(thale cress) hypothetical protein n=1 Tax=Arabidopsis thaliana TaxID=3702 RepID=A0A7G2FH61_ARATH|nr:unnamed protein product [Arabidopsis thaliana]